MKIKIGPLDRAFSKFIRLLSGGYCKRCWLLKLPKPYKGWKNLDCAHFHARSKRATRWDADNVAPLCMGCHLYLDTHHYEKIEFFMEILGKERFDALDERANQIKKFSKEELKELEIEYKQKIKELENDN